jgi:HSP20 family protein
MTLMRFDPFRELDRFADQALTSARTPRTMPIIVAIDVPGVNQDDVDVTVERNVIELSARRQPLRQAGDEVIIDETPQGEFRRQLFLGDNLDPDKLTAQYDRGVLTLTIPVSEASKPRKIEIGGSTETPHSIDAKSEVNQPVNA